MTDHFDVSTLNWVKGEIDETLKQARLALEKYAENPEDEAQIHFCSVHLHQVAGTLEMVELFGAGRFAAEMERVADALPKLATREQALDVLVRTILLLPDYLEVLQNGQPDSPVILLPLINELRRARGETELSVIDVFQPNLDAEPPVRSAPVDLTELAHKLRPHYQAALVNILKGPDVSAGAKIIIAVFEKLIVGSSSPSLRRLFWIAQALAEALRDGGLPPDGAVKQLLARFDQIIKQVGATGGSESDAALGMLMRNALYELAKSTSSGPLVSQIRDVFRLDALLPSDNALEQIRSGMGGFNSELKKTVSRDVLDDLSRIKDVLDLFSRNPNRLSSELTPVATALVHIADVLRLLREAELGDKLRLQAAQIEQIVHESDPVTESLLMGVAESVLSVEAALSDWGAVSPMESAGQPASGDAQTDKDMEHRRIIRQVMKEARDDLVRAREAINAYVQKPTDFSLDEAPRLMRQVIGSLSMLSYHRVAQVLRACRNFVEKDIAGKDKLPPPDSLDALADALMSVEYYLEAFVESRVHPSSVLDVAERAVARLGYPVDSIEEEVPETIVVAPPDDTSGEILDETPDARDAFEELELVEPSAPEFDIAPAAMEFAPLADAAPAASVSAKADAAPQVDEEILEIFMEEAQEELQKIDELLPRWQGNLGDDEALRDLRRSFHTLKGSGRIVGAKALGEFAWAFENLLNRVLDKTVEPSASVLDILSEARQTLPELLEEFRSGSTPERDVAGLQEAAFALAKAVAPQTPAETPVRENVPTGQFEISDPVLRDIYTKEAEGHIASMRAFVANCQASRCRINDPLVRALHTLCGSSRTADVATVAELMATLEKYAKVRQISQMPVEQEALTLFVESADYTESVIQSLRGEKTAFPLGDLPARAAQLLAVAENQRSGAAEPAPDSALDELSLEPAGEAPKAQLVSDDVFADLSGPEGLTVESESASELPFASFTSADADVTPQTPPLSIADDSLMEFELLDGDLWGDAPGESEHEPSHEAASSPAFSLLDEFADEISSPRDAGENAAESPLFFDGSESLSLSDDTPGDLAWFSDQDTDRHDGVPADGGFESGLEILAGENERAPTAERELEPTALFPLEPEAELSATVPFGLETKAPSPAETHDILDVYAHEADDLLNSSRQLLQEWTARPEDRRAVEALQRVLHTLKGSARWAEVNPMADLGHALESTCAAVVAGRLRVSPDVVRTAQLAHARLGEMLHELKDGRNVSDASDLIEKLKSLGGSGASAARAKPSRDYDPELLSIFLEEGLELLNASDETLQSWIAAPQDKRAVETLQRHLHTLKGGARMAGVSEIGDLGHSLESMLAGVADGLVPVSSRMFTLLQRAQDRLAVMVEQLRHNDPLPGGEDLIAEIDALVSGKEAAQSPQPSQAARPEQPPQPAWLVAGQGEAEAPVVMSQPPTVSTPTVAEEEESESPPVSAEALDPITDTDAEAEPRDRRQGPRAQYELVRVRSDLLDSMVNVAGEASIFRSRVEQQIGGFRFNLDELNQVIERLRERLRMFDIETEAQIQSRHEEAATRGYEEFDPLEFDRFTNMQQFSRSMMESLGDLASVGGVLNNLTRETETLLVQQARVNTELQEGLMHTRMVPLVQHAPRLRRIVRQTCETLGKEAELRFIGAEVEMDRTVVERILAPLEHLLRNAVAHGIELPVVREALGKPRSGTIVIHQVREGTEVVVRVVDDGAGININAVREKAIARGLMDRGAQLQDREILLFILESGFSTAESLTQIAGRGVGMDVVNSEVKNLNGALAISSDYGKGTTFTIRLPMTLTVSRALLVYAGDDLYAVPLLSIEGIVRASDQEISDWLAVESPVYRWLGQDYAMLHLATVLGVEGATTRDQDEHKQSILLAHSGEHRVAIVVDGLLGSREIVVKPVGRQLGTLRGISGATILGDGRVALILELPGLIRLGLARRADRATSADDASSADIAAKPTVMVVDDSITVRKVTSRLLERNDMLSVSAKDGMEAVSMLQEVIPDVMLLDIEMPRMDGYELATHVRNDPRLRDVPIIMITSRSGDKHRQRAMQIGVNIYMTKPFQENELLENIRALLRERRPVTARAR